MFEKSKKQKINQSGFTLIELLIVIAVVGVLAAIILIAINPPRIIENANYQTTVANLNQIAKASQMHEIATGLIPADANRDIPSEFMPYLGPGIWPRGPFDGSVYDWDNWTGQTCHDSSDGGVQITLRDIKRYKGVNYSYTIPNASGTGRTTITVPGQPHFAIYYAIYGEGIPHCTASNVIGICLNCESKFPPTP